jgi:hypothetical protein
MKITWEYLAGFFDGEGCVSTHQNRARSGSFGTSVTFSQSAERGRLLLVRIREFLAEHGIKSYLLQVNKNAKTEMFNLTIMARPSVELVLSHLRGRVDIKKVVVEDTWRFLKLFPSTRGATTAERNILATMDVNLDEMRQDRAAGLSYAAIGRKHGISTSAVQWRLVPGVKERARSYKKTA